MPAAQNLLASGADMAHAVKQMLRVDLEEVQRVRGDIAGNTRLCHPAIRPEQQSAGFGWMRLSHRTMNPLCRCRRKS